jgi:hypothetical protein
MVSSAPVVMTRKRSGAQKPPELVLNLGPITDAHRDACARVLARLAVAKAMKKLGLDTGPTIGDNVGPQHKSGPAGASNTDGAQELVT